MWDKLDVLRRFGVGAAAATAAAAARIECGDC